MLETSRSSLQTDEVSQQVKELEANVKEWRDKSERLSLHLQLVKDERKRIEE